MRLTRLEKLVYHIIAAKQDFYDNNEPIGFSDDDIDTVAKEIIETFSRLFEEVRNANAR